MNELNNLPPGALSVIIAVSAVVVLIILIVYCLYVKNLQDTLLAVRPQNRQMPPAQVWLLLLNFLILLALIPLFKGLREGLSADSAMFTGMDYFSSAVNLFVLIWQFRIVQKISASIALEYASRNRQVEARPTYQTGLVYCILLLASLLADFLPHIPALKGAIGIGGLVYWIMYWSKTATYKKELRNMPEHTDEGSMVFQDLY